MEDAGKNASAWGTAQWVATFRWSRMDRKRRARAERVVAAAYPERFAELKLAAGYGKGADAHALAALMDRYHVEPRHVAAGRYRAARACVDRYVTEALDEVFARLLSQAWGLQ